MADSSDEKRDGRGVHNGEFHMAKTVEKAKKSLGIKAKKPAAAKTKAEIKKPAAKGKKEGPSKKKVPK